MAAPEPFAVLPVDELGLDIRPATHGFLQCFLITKILVDVIPSYHILGLYPPVEIVINMTRVKVCLMNHATIRAQSFLRSLSHLTDNGLHLVEHLSVT